MKTPRSKRSSSSVGLAALSCAAVLSLLSVNVIAITSESTGECIAELVGNGFCDNFQNDETCEYDGGDCCECTCVSTQEYVCGAVVTFACVDPSASCFDEDAVGYVPDYESSTSTYYRPLNEFECVDEFVSDADCDPHNNNEDCGYDGGDCCKCTCVSTPSFTCGDEERGGFSCLDPAASCVDDDDVTVLPTTDTFPDSGTTTDLQCIPDFYADGICDQINNKGVCGYDGGDCCSCTCVDTELYPCGDERYGGFACVDPNAVCVNDDDVTSVPNDDTLYDDNTGLTTKSECLVGFFSNGDCDPDNNNEECGYDGGDCCECTCESTETFTCGNTDHGGFACVDPGADCFNEDDDIGGIFSLTSDDPSGTGSCIPGFYSDGQCDLSNNREVCGYDGGDCCQCTCVSTENFMCGAENHGGFACLDPNAPCVDDDDFTGTDDITNYFSDTEEEYEDDITEDTFTDTEEEQDDVTDDVPDSGQGDDITIIESSTGTSNTEEEEEQDGITIIESSGIPNSEEPAISCFEDGLSNGACDPENNNEECGYDGGDCCECTCASTTDFTCGNFDCIDPSIGPTTPCGADAYVEAGTKTTVTTSSSAYNTRPGAASGGAGCGEDGCKAELTRDGISDGIESMWGCAQKLVPGGGLCEIEFMFEDPQDVVEVEVAFFKGDDRSRTLQAMINGEVIGEFDSSTGSTFSALGIEGTAVETMTFTTVGLTEDDWISLTEVRFLVEP